MAAKRKSLKIAMLAPPWLSLYPGCYYGIENVVHNLTSALTDMGHHVELFTVGGSTTNATKRHWYHEEDQYKHIHRPWYEVTSIITSHILHALHVIRNEGDFDIIHDHNSFMGPAIMSYVGGNLPPVLHTLHEPFTDERLVARGIPDNRMMFEQFRPLKRMYFNTVSQVQYDHAPAKLRSSIIGVVHNGIDLRDYKYAKRKDDYLLSVARIAADKGQGAAAKICNELGEKLVIAGMISSGISTPKQAMKELGNPDSSFQSDPDFAYFRDEVAPYLKTGQVEYIGTIRGEQKLQYFSKAKGFLFPINWEEPFGMAVIDALASGTPVVAFRRGAMPELIQHGVNGFLADTYDEFKAYVQRVGEIDPAACRRTVQERFSAEILAKNYVKAYEEVIKRSNLLPTFTANRPVKKLKKIARKVSTSRPKLRAPQRAARLQPADEKI